MARRGVEATGLQYNFGGDFGENPGLDLFTERVLQILPRLEEYAPLVVADLSSENNCQGIVSSLTVIGNGKERTAHVLHSLNDFKDYCLANKGKGRGFVIIVPEVAFGPMSPETVRILGEVFGSFNKDGKVGDPSKYHVWIVEKETLADSPIDRRREVLAKEILTDYLGLCSAEYHRDIYSKIGWFSGIPPKRRSSTERDYSSNPMIMFCSDWARIVLDYHGIKVDSDDELQKTIHSSRNFFFLRQWLDEFRGMVLIESSGIVRNSDSKGLKSTLFSGEETSCFQHNNNGRLPFSVGEERESKEKCGDCQNNIRVTAVGVGRYIPNKGIEVFFTKKCPHCGEMCRNARKCLDPALILDPETIYSNQFKEIYRKGMLFANGNSR